MRWLTGVNGWLSDFYGAGISWQGQLRGAGTYVIAGTLGVEVEAILRHPSQRNAGQALQWVDANSGMPEAIEARLFGGAAGQPGAIELAHNGWLVLVSPNELAPSAQQQLAAVIESGTLTLRDGSERQVQVRLIIWQPSSAFGFGNGASGLSAVLQGLVTHRCTLPTLPERLQRHPELLEDALALVAARLAATWQLCRGSMLRPGAVVASCVAGDMHELHRVCERCLVAAHGAIIAAADLALVHAGTDSENRMDSDASRSLSLVPLVELVEIERRHILGVLEALGGNKKATAETLGIDRSTLYAKLRSYST